MKITELQGEKFEVRIDKLPPELAKPIRKAGARGWYAWCGRHKKLTSLAVFLIMAFLTGVAIYGFQSETGFVKFMSFVVPYPAAKVDGKSITYYRYLKELRQAENILQGDSVLTPIAPANIRQQTFERLIQHTLLEQLAKRHGIEVGKSDIEDRYGTMLEEGKYTDDELVLLKSMFKAFILADRLQKELGPGGVEQELAQLEKDRVKRYINP